MRSILKDIELTEVVIDHVPYRITPLPEEFGSGYYATTCGSILSMVRNEPRILKEEANKNGYKYTMLGRGKRFLVHRLIAATFHDYHPHDQHGSERWQVNHIDGDPHNNKAANLEWCSPGENKAHQNVLRQARAEAKAQAESNEEKA